MHVFWAPSPCTIHAQCCLSCAFAIPAHVSQCASHSHGWSGSASLSQEAQGGATSELAPCRVPEECEQWCADVIEACLQLCPNCRPSARDVHTALRWVGAAAWAALLSRDQVTWWQQRAIKARYHRHVNQLRLHEVNFSHIKQIYAFIHVTNSVSSLHGLSPPPPSPCMHPHTRWMSFHTLPLVPWVFLTHLSKMLWHVSRWHARLSQAEGLLEALHCSHEAKCMPAWQYRCHWVRNPWSGPECRVILYVKHMMFWGVCLLWSEDCSAGKTSC